MSTLPQLAISFSFAQGVSFFTICPSSAYVLPLSSFPSTIFGSAMYQGQMIFFLSGHSVLAELKFQHGVAVLPGRYPVIMTSVDSTMPRQLPAVGPSQGTCETCRTLVRRGPPGSPFLGPGYSTAQVAAQSATVSHREREWCVTLPMATYLRFRTLALSLRCGFSRP